MRSFDLQRTKSEAPLIAVFAVFSLLVSLVFYPMILWYSFLVFPVMAVSYLLLRKMKLGIFNKSCFLILDEEGVRYCFNLFQRPRFLKWNQVDKVNFQMYELNFKLKESGDIICMQTSYLEHESEIEELRTEIKKYCETM